MDVSSAAFIQNPYSFYAQKREQGRVLNVRDFTWTVTGYGAMSSLLANPNAGRGNIGQLPQAGGSTEQLDAIYKANPALKILNQWMLFKNPPEHAAIRKSVADQFTIKMVDRLHHDMGPLLDELIRNIKHENTHRTFDLVPMLAYQLPLRLICRMIGIPEHDWQRFQHWTGLFSYAVQSNFMGLGAKELSQINTAAVELNNYFQVLLETKKSKPHDDLISRLMGAGLSDDSILSNSVFLLFAGQETSSLSIGNALHALLSHPKQLAALRASPSLANNAVEETLRFDPPIQMIGRLALQNIEVDEFRIMKGDHMHLFLGAAGRDPSANSSPDQFDIERTSIKHLAFARGAHHCLGASLARKELDVVLTKFIAEFPDLHLNGPSTRQNTWLMRGFQSIPVSY